MQPRRFLSSLFLLTLLAIAGDVLAIERVEVIGLEYPPFSSLTMEDGGINNRLLKDYLSDRTDVDIVNVYYPPARAQSIIASERWCVSFYPPHHTTPQDIRFIRLRDDPVAMRILRLKQESDFHWESLSEFSGASMAILSFVLEGPYFQKFSDAGINIVEVGSLQQSFKLVLSGRVEYSVGDIESMKYALETIETDKELQLSDTVLSRVEVGAFVHPSCHHVFFPQSKR